MVNTDLATGNEFTAKAAKDLLIEQLTEPRPLYQLTSSTFTPNGNPVWRICTEFKVDKHSAGRVLFIFNVGHLSFRKARMTANLMGLSKGGTETIRNRGMRQADAGGGGRRRVANDIKNIRKIRAGPTTRRGPHHAMNREITGKSPHQKSICQKGVDDRFPQASRAFV